MARRQTRRWAGAHWADRGVELHVVPGNHANLMYEPHVEVLAKELAACLDQAQCAEAKTTGAADKVDR